VTAQAHGPGLFFLIVVLTLIVLNALTPVILPRLGRVSSPLAAFACLLLRLCDVDLSYPGRILALVAGL
jgi:hypothetical protein